MRYFFNLAGAVHDPDNQGFELPSMQTARIMAVTHASEVIRSRPELVWSGDEVRVEVTNGDRLLLFTVMVIGVDAAAGRGQP